MIPLILGAGQAAKTVSHSSTTWSPTQKGSSVTLSNNNLTATMTNGYAVFGTTSHSSGSGKWYFETTYNQIEGNEWGPVIGIGTISTSLYQPWSSTGELTFYGTTVSAQLIWSNNQRYNYGVTIAAGTVIGIAVDFINMQMTFYKNGVSMGLAYNSQYLASNTTYYPLVASPAAGAYNTVITTNFGETAFQYPVSGFSGW
jgi:hypothetical protein